MKIPRELQIPAIVFTLEAVFILGLSMIFLVLVRQCLADNQIYNSITTQFAWCYRTAPRLRCG